MKFQILILVFSFSIFSTLSHAGDITQGVIVEGESLPIGISLEDTFSDIESTLASIEEFDLGDADDSYCEYTKCTYIARNLDDEELGRIVVFFSFDDDSQTYTASKMRWTFDNWVTTAGLSLKSLRDINSDEELRDFYPGASRARVTSNTALLRSSVDGLLMVSAQFSRAVSYGMLIPTKN